MGMFELKVLKLGVSCSPKKGKNKYTTNHLFVFLIPGPICFVT